MANRGRKPKLLVVVPFGYKFHEKRSWVSHARIINHSMGYKNLNKKKITIPMSSPYPLSVTLKKHIFSFFACFAILLLVFKTVHTLSLKNDHVFV